MSYRPIARVSLAVLPLLLAALTACSELTGPDSDEGRTISGAWRGTARIGTQTRSTSMTLTQSGNSVTGTMTLSGALVNRSLVGEFADGRVTWFVAAGCERWTGVLVPDATSNQLSGAIIQDLSACGAGARGASGTLTMDRQ
jgi:hypothetical protein